jgi:hypothetical protein
LHDFEYSLLYDQLSFRLSAELCVQVGVREIDFRLASPNTLRRQNGAELVDAVSGAVGVLVDLRQGFGQAKDLSEASADESAGMGQARRTR